MFNATLRRFPKRTPWCLTLFRVATAPAPWIALALGWPIEPTAALIPLALLSDIFDGVIARAQGTATVLLRRADGWADLCFTLSYTIAAFAIAREELVPWIIPISLLIAYQLLRTALDFRKFGRGTAYHFYSAKAWGLAYYAWLFACLTGASWMEPALLATLALGFVVNTEGIIATAYAPRWIVDAPHALAAIRKARAPQSVCDTGSVSSLSRTSSANA